MVGGEAALPLPLLGWRCRGRGNARAQLGGAAIRGGGAPHPSLGASARPPTRTPHALNLQLKRADVPLELEDIGLPMNTYGPKVRVCARARVDSRRQLAACVWGGAAVCVCGGGGGGGTRGPPPPPPLAHTRTRPPPHHLPPPPCAQTPFTGKVISVERIVGPKATGETCHIIIQTDGKIPFVEGQSYGVIPPGTKINSKGKEVPHGTRLYSIASTRYGDKYDGQTVSVCVCACGRARACPWLACVRARCELGHPARPALPPPTPTPNTHTPRPRCACAARPTGTPSSRLTTQPRRASAPTSCATPSPGRR